MGGKEREVEREGRGGWVEGKERSTEKGRPRRLSKPSQTQRKKGETSMINGSEKATSPKRGEDASIREARSDEAISGPARRSLMMLISEEEKARFQCAEGR